MAAYAEGLNILHNANAGKAQRTRGRRDRAAARSRVLPVRPRHPGGRRGVAARQRRSRRGCSTSPPTRSTRPRPRRLRRPRLRLGRGALDGAGGGRRGRSRRRCSRPRSTSGSTRRAHGEFAQQAASARCARSSAATSRSREAPARARMSKPVTVRRARLLRRERRSRPQEDLPRAVPHDEARAT